LENKNASEEERASEVEKVSKVEKASENKSVRGRKGVEEQKGIRDQKAESKTSCFCYSFHHGSVDTEDDTSESSAEEVRCGIIF
jgi:hypothetical protein